MVKPDIKHNYYADLELPSTASVDDVRKAYRKLALLYHPDRNSGKEEECIPKFQAIQAANEVLSDPTQKAKYDTDRRKAGLYPTWQSRPPATGHPYAATSPYPPPPRRTEHPTQSQQRANQAHNPAQNGADRFSNFPRPAPTGRKDAAQDRTNMFRAWQNMSTAQERQRNFTAPGQPPPQPPQPQAQHQPQPQAQAPPQPNNARRRPPTAPRQESTMPSEERIRAGMNYRKVPRNVFDAGAGASGQSAWASFQKVNEGKPGVGKSNTMKTPKKQGFDPNTPGSDERAAPAAGSHYAHRHRSEDLGRPSQRVPPPPPGPPPPGTASSQDPPDLRPPTRARTFDDQVPYSEGDRKRTPYSTFIGERTSFPTAEQLRRSASSRDTSKLDPGAAANNSRARSNSPVRRNREGAGAQKKGFVAYSSSDDEDDADADPTARSSNESPQVNERPGTAPEPSTADRPKKTPTPPSRRFDGSYNPTSPPPVPPVPDIHTTADASKDANGGDEASNMYDSPSSSSPPVTPTRSRNRPFHRQSWLASMHGSNSTRRATSRSSSSPSSVPKWAVPSSVTPVTASPKRVRMTPFTHASVTTATRQRRKKETFVTAADPTFVSATKIERAAFIQFQTELRAMHGYVPDNFDMTVFFNAVSEFHAIGSTGHVVIDGILKGLLVAYPSLRHRHRKEGQEEKENVSNVDDKPSTNASHRGHRRFNFSDPNWFPPSSSPSKSRSAENINTNFSQDGEFNGHFTGAPDSAGPTSAAAAADSPARKSSPARRPGVSQKSSARSSTLDVPPPPATDPRAASANTRPWGSDGLPKVTVQEPEGDDAPTTSWKDQWEPHFKDGTWALPRQQDTSGAAGQASQAQNPGNASAAPPPPPAIDSEDAMDIDTPPQQPPTVPDNTSAQPQAEARTYAVPPSTWRQQQQARLQKTNGPTFGATPTFSPTTPRKPLPNDGGTRLNTTLDDLRNVEPIGQPSSTTSTTTTTDPSNSTGGLANFSNLSATLPFQSQPSPAIFSPFEPRALKLPELPIAPGEPTRLTKTSWLAHVDRFAAYLRAYHAFNGAMLDHFVAREKLLGEKLVAGPDGGVSFLEATGDTSGMSPTKGRTGYGTYSQAVLEDRKVREAWNLGCEQHADAVKKFAALRERVRRLVGSGGLMEA